MKEPSHGTSYLSVRHGWDLNPWSSVYKTDALPLGHHATLCCKIFINILESCSCIMWIWHTNNISVSCENCNILESRTRAIAKILMEKLGIEPRTSYMQSMYKNNISVSCENFNILESRSCVMWIWHTNTQWRTLGLNQGPHTKIACTPPLSLDPILFADKMQLIQCTFYIHHSIESTMEW